MDDLHKDIPEQQESVVLGEEPQHSKNKKNKKNKKNEKNDNKQNKRGKPNRCGNCQQTGHNKTTCKSKPVVDSKSAKTASAIPLPTPLSIDSDDLMITGDAGPNPDAKASRTPSTMPSLSSKFTSCGLDDPDYRQRLEAGWLKSSHFSHIISLILCQQFTKDGLQSQPNHLCHHSEKESLDTTCVHPLAN
ncbi:hypothetical protein SAMD00019534_006130 [Acytostelium subglobosum LB1]|uniref:hypothetical protein n=1 Tax=Acytostelium subglobosum LB1 TaxID=1410327 RepID=UPI000644C60F|nr:hypothetical protein SAMD00019534_006130 [Acytostelium subglobosum LB1]GAM17438.1 hypothetical protein SAMD00019534_006130 [Acytostelium subglobosum LB1]|eukprot:XP_012759500.1 hypothetical protein SAMD00019534_006130 [Acytostelium subglobosum LB1]